MKSLGAGLAGQKSAIEKPNFVLVSLDFEGSPRDSRIFEIGIAKLHSHQLLSEMDSYIISFNFALVKGSDRKFMFGTTTRLYYKTMRQTIIELFHDLRQEDPQRDIILVSHHILS